VTAFPFERRVEDDSLGHREILAGEVSGPYTRDDDWMNLSAFGRSGPKRYPATVG
jgi:hypothetical protein